VAHSLSAAFALIALVTLLVGCGRGAPAPSAPAVTRTPGVDVTDEPPAVDLAKDWPWWRGPLGNNVAVCETAPTTWDETTNVVWSVPVPGRGHASPTVCGDGVYLTTADEQNERQIVVAYDRATGEERWQTVVSEGGFAGHAHDKNTQANSTIACDGERLFTAFLHDDEIWLYALDLGGSVVWSTKAGDFAPQFGYAPSPAVYGSAVLVALDSLAGGRLVAIDRRSGKIAWIADRTPWASYSSPAVGKIAGQDQVVLTGGKLTTSYDPKTGEELWRVAAGPETTCGTPTFDDERVYASGGHPERMTWAVSAAGSGTILWSNKERVYEPSLLAAKGLVFAVTDEGIAICWDGTTGEERWKERLGGNFSASPILCGGNVYVTSDRGETFIFEATGEEYREVATNQLGTDAYATPVICDSRIYLRVGDSSSGERQERLVCVGQ
jgi:hypothetical protein